MSRRLKGGSWLSTASHGRSGSTLSIAIRLRKASDRRHMSAQAQAEAQVIAYTAIGGFARQDCLPGGCAAYRTGREWGEAMRLA